MYVTFGNYAHATNEIAPTISVKRKRDANGAAYEDQYTWDMTGRLSATDVPSLTVAIAKLANAYALDYQDLKLLNDDGSATAHALINANSIRGVYVESPPEFPVSGASDAQYTTYRDYRVVVKAEFPVGIPGGLIDIQDSVNIVGDGGPEILVQEFLNAAPQVQTVRQFTKVAITQAGQARSYGTFWRPNRPVYPDYLQRKRSSVRCVPPIHLNAFNIDPGKAIFTTTWSYYMELPFGVDLPSAFRSTPTG